MAELRRVCVFCGSSPGARPGYVAAARALGRLLAERGVGVVTGGGCVGLMGAVADAALDAGGEVIGVIPHHLVSREVAHPGLSELLEVDTMFERKRRMMELSDGFVSLPGGVGTLDELFEILTWDQLGLLAKPCALLDVEGYWEPLRSVLDRMVDERFLRPVHRALLLHAGTPEEALALLAAWRPAETDKWLDR
ncbi:MAG: TIGR00730 family Rossman fold protein [Myxococcota bacterium]|nr:TIGR00730 family Rossman fold protein [Myxococcota bacterium]